MQPRLRHNSSESLAPSALRALFGVSLGWLFLLASAHTLQAGEMLPSHGGAELRLGRERPAQVGDLAAQQPALRLLSTRARSTPHQPSSEGPGLASIPRAFRIHATTSAACAIKLECQARRAITRIWPLPRSSCENEDADRA